MQESAIIFTCYDCVRRTAEGTTQSLGPGTLRFLVDSNGVPRLCRYTQESSHVIFPVEALDYAKAA